MSSSKRPTPPNKAALLAAAALLALPACAAGEAIGSTQSANAECIAYGKVDRDGDNRVSRAEWSRYRGAFGAWDADDDGRISRAEYRACLPAAAGLDDGDGPLGIDWQEDDYGLHDADGDGLFDESEFWGVASFDRTDADSNDWIEREAGEWDFPRE